MLQSDNLIGPNFAWLYQVCHVSAIQHCKLASKLNVLVYLDRSKQQYLVQAWALACYSTCLFTFTIVFNCVCVFPATILYCVRTFRAGASTHTHGHNTRQKHSNQRAMWMNLKLQNDWMWVWNIISAWTSNRCPRNPICAMGIIERQLGHFGLTQVIGLTASYRNFSITKWTIMQHNFSCADLIAWLVSIHTTANTSQHCWHYNLIWQPGSI